MEKKICEWCGKSNARVRYYEVYNEVLCETCFRIKRDQPVYDKPKIGEVKYTKDGKLICHICGRAFHKLQTHIGQRHHVTAKEYKEKFELNRTFSLTSDYMKEVCRDNVKSIISVSGYTKNTFKKGHNIRDAYVPRLQTIKNRRKAVSKYFYLRNRMTPEEELELIKSKKNKSLQVYKENQKVLQKMSDRNE